MSLERRLREELQREASLIEPDVERDVWVCRSTFATTQGNRSGATACRDGSGGRRDHPAGAGSSPRRGAGRSPSPSPTASIETSPSASGAADALQIAGTYLTTLDAADPAVKRDSLAGTWTMRLQPDGAVFLSSPASFVPGAVGVSGVAFSLVGDRFRTNLFYNEYCNSIGNYVWSRAAGGLTFTSVDDTCTIRRTLLATTPWLPAP